MSISIFRTQDVWWAGTPDGVAKVNTPATTTAQLLADRPAIERAAASTDTVAPSALELRSPVTAPCRVVAQMTNFASRVKDAGMTPTTVPLTFFRKASGSITGPVDEIVKPRHVRLLDYEVEIGLVIGRHPRRRDDQRRQPPGLRLRRGGDQRRIGARCAADENPVLRIEVVSDVHTCRTGTGAARRRRTQPLRRAAHAAASERRTATTRGRGRHDLSARRGACGARAVPAAVRRRPRHDGHARRHRAERPAQAGRS